MVGKAWQQELKEAGHTASRKSDECCAWLVFSLLPFGLGPLAHGMVPSTFKVGFSFSAKPLTKCPRRSVPNPVLKAQQHLSSKLRVCDPRYVLVFSKQAEAPSEPILLPRTWSGSLCFQCLEKEAIGPPGYREALVANTTGSACFWPCPAPPFWPDH